MEINTRAFSLDEAQRVVAALQNSNVATPCWCDDQYTLEGASIPNLDAYRLVGDIELVAEFPRNALPCVHEICRIATQLRCRFEFGSQYGESGKKYDPKRDDDISIAFGEGYYGPMIRLAIGDVSPGSKDPDERCRLFNDLLGKASINDASVRKLGDQTILGTTLPILRDPWDPKPESSVWLTPSSCDLQGMDFSVLIISFDSLPTAMRNGASLVSALEEERITSASLAIMLEPDHLGHALGVLRHLKAPAWSATFDGAPKQNPQDLKEIVSKYREFWLRMYELKLKGIGRFSVDAHGVDGRIAFSFYGKINKKSSEENLRESICPIFEGIIDPWDDRVI